MALVLDLALVLECDEQIIDHGGGRAAGLSHLLPRYFRGPHFDWTAASSTTPHVAPPPPSTRVLDLRRKAALEAWDVREWPPAPIANSSSRAPIRVRLLATGASTMGPVSLLHRRPANIAAAQRALGATLSRFLVVPLHARRGALTKLRSTNPRMPLSASDSALAGCLLHVVLAPTEHLVRKLAAVPNAPRGRRGRRSCRADGYAPTPSDRGCTRADG